MNNSTNLHQKERILISRLEDLRVRDVKVIGVCVCLFFFLKCAFPTIPDVV